MPPRLPTDLSTGAGINIYNRDAKAIDCDGCINIRQTGYDTGYEDSCTIKKTERLARNASDQKEAPLPGLNKKSSSSSCLSDRRSRAAARAFSAAILFAFGDETGLLDGLPLLLAGLVPAAALLLVTLAALLATLAVLLVRWIRHSLLLVTLETR
jgi:hypothetical protein